MKGITKVVKSLKESGLLITRISKTIKNEAKERKGEFLPMLLGTLAASMLVFRKHINRKRSNKSSWRNNKSRSQFLMLPHPLINFELKNYYLN